MQIVRTQSEIDALVNDCVEREETGSKYPGMTYEQGVRATIEWLEDRDQPHPMNDD